MRPTDLHLDAHPVVEMIDLIRAEEDTLAVIHEGQYSDTDGEDFHIYTLAGTLDGRRIEVLDHVRRVIVGATVGGDAIIVHAKNRREADYIALNGVLESIKSMREMALAGALDTSGNEGIITEASVRAKTS